MVKIKDVVERVNNKIKVVEGTENVLMAKAVTKEKVAINDEQTFTKVKGVELEVKNVGMDKDPTVAFNETKVFHKMITFKIYEEQL